MQDKRKNGLVYPLFALVVIALIMGAILGLTNFATADIIQEQILQKAQESRQKIFPEADSFTEIQLEERHQNLAPGLESVFSAQSQGELVGYVFTAANKGYAGDVPAVIGINLDGKIIGIEVQDNKETPGLGTKVALPDFLDPIIGTSVDDSMEIVKSYETKPGISAVTGATFSSAAIAADLKDARAVFNELTGEEQ
ncbi:MAG: RnfABCDGE type electron transport complex subunit G [Coriobacteriia bacterium]|nr:RnfABCDGE type electron transport complex subunit G [Coriobacteriia bacterium]